MTAFVIVDVDIKDLVLYAEYMAQTPATVSAYGGQYLARGGKTEVLEGDWTPRRLVILEFESLNKARQWLDSPEYTRVKQLRHRAAHTNMVAIEGL